MKSIDNYINGNLTDAKKGARLIGWYTIYDALIAEYGRNEQQAAAEANYLKGKGTFQAACDAAPIRGGAQ